MTPPWLEAMKARDTRALPDEWPALLALVEALGERLARIEWITEEADAHARVGFCGNCGRARGEGHEKTCWLAALLARYQRGPEA